MMAILLAYLGIGMIFMWIEIIGEIVCKKHVERSVGLTIVCVILMILIRPIELVKLLGKMVTLIMEGEES